MRCVVGVGGDHRAPATDRWVDGVTGMPYGGDEAVRADQDETSAERLELCVEPAVEVNGHLDPSGIVIEAIV